MSRIGVVGARLEYWSDPSEGRGLIFNKIAELPQEDVIVSGESPAGGVDIWARQAAAFYRREFKAYPVDSREKSNFGFAWAALARNRRLVRNVDRLIAFPRPHSKGTNYTVEYAESQNKDVEVLP